MTAPSPILEQHARRGAFFSEYGAAEGQAGIRVVAAFGPIELEYAAIRRSCILLDQPQRGVVEVTGPDRIEFLNRMITQDVRGIAPGESRRSFWLNRKGRIDADLRVWHFDDRTLLEVDALAAGRTVDGLSAYIVMDDAAIRDISAATHRLSLHGPAAAAVLADLAEDSASREALLNIAPGRCVLFSLRGEPVVAAREDQTAEIGLELMCPAGFAGHLYGDILDRGGWTRAENADDRGHASPTAGAARAEARVRPAGWHAFNIARIEAGTPLYNIDFGPDSLPAETGVFEDRVSLTKGCYLGQEIVARMHARGHPKRRLVGIKLARDIPLPGPADNGLTVPRQPETGSLIFAASEGAESVAAASTEDASKAAIGAVTSSASSPMLGQTPLCLAMVKYELAVPGAAVGVEAEGRVVRGVIQPSLRFYSRP